MSPAIFGLFVAGLVALIGGAELLVRGASRLAAALGIAPLVIGLTVVAWGTGSPELAVGVKAAVAGRPDLTIGNVVGSNIANVLLILGFAALVIPLKVSERLVRLDVPLMIGASVLTLILALDGTLGTLDGVILVSLLVGYTVWTIRESRLSGASGEAGGGGPDEVSGGPTSESIPDEAATASRKRSTIFVSSGLLVAVGLYLLVKGSDWLVLAASDMAAAWGFSELIIGLTIVAIGTSLPELATSAVAAARGERDIAVGNAVGSNLFNLLAVLGVTGIVARGGVPVAAAALSLDIPIMIAVAVACLPVFFAGYVIYRWNGAVFLGLYAGYIAYLVLAGTEHQALAGFTSVMLMFVLPLVSFTLVLVAVQSWRRR